MEKRYGNRQNMMEPFVAFAVPQLFLGLMFKRQTFGEKLLLILAVSLREFPQCSDCALILRQHAGIDKHFIRLMCLDPWLESLQLGKGELDRFLVTAGRVVCKLSHGGSDLRNLLALPILVDGHGLAHRRQKMVAKLNHPPPDGRRSSVGWTYPSEKTGMHGWGTWIRTKINGVRVRYVRPQGTRTEATPRHRRIAAAFPDSTHCSKPSPIPTTRTMPKPKSGSMNMTPKSSTTCP
jgi:hypothetical protein